MLGEINIGAHAVISQKGICVPVAMIIPAPSIHAAPIVIGEKCWLATDVLSRPA